MQNYKGTGERIDVLSSTAAHTSGVPLLEVSQDIVVVPETTGLTGTKYAGRTQGIFALPVVGSPTKGQLVYMTVATGVLKLTTTTGDRPIGKVVRIAGEQGVPTGFMWVYISPHPFAVTA